MNGVDTVSQTCRCSWDEVWRMSAMEFFNILCYHNDTVEHNKNDIKKWQNEN